MWFKHKSVIVYCGISGVGIAAINCYVMIIEILIPAIAGLVTTITTLFGKDLYYWVKGKFGREKKSLDN